MPHPKFKTAYGFPDSVPKEVKTSSGFDAIQFTDTINQSMGINTGSLIFPTGNTGPNAESTPGSSTVVIRKLDTPAWFVELDRARVDWLIQTLQHWRKTGRLHGSH